MKAVNEKQEGVAKDILEEIDDITDLVNQTMLKATFLSKVCYTTGDGIDAQPKFNNFSEDGTAFMGLSLILGDINEACIGINEKVFSVKKKLEE